MAQVASAALPLELRTVVAGLVSADVSDDQQWIVGLMRKHGLAVVTLLWRMLGSEPDVLDAYQTAVCRLTARICLTRSEARMLDLSTCSRYWPPGPDRETSVNAISV